MTKQDVLRQISEKTGINLLTSRSVLESFCEVVKESLIEGEPIYIRTLESFILKQRAQKTARNISQNRAVTIAAHKLPYFKPSSEFSNQVRAQPMPKKEKERK